MFLNDTNLLNMVIPNSYVNQRVVGNLTLPFWDLPCGLNINKSDIVIKNFCLNRVNEETWIQ
jgi:hypothetical protein